MSNDEQDIRQWVATWIEATRRGDAEKVLDLITEDAVFLQPGRAPMRKADFAAAQAAQKLAHIDVTSTIEEITVVGDWAWMWTTLSVEVTPQTGAKPIRRAGHTLTVLRREAGQWKLARDANLLTRVERSR